MTGDTFCVAAPYVGAVVLEIVQLLAWEHIPNAIVNFVWALLRLFIHYALLVSLISRAHSCHIQCVIPANTSKFRNFGFMGLIALRGLVCISPPKHIIVTEILSSCTFHSLSLPLIAVGRNRDLLEQLAIQCCERAEAQVRLPPLDLASPSCKEKVPGYIISAIRK